MSQRFTGKAATAATANAKARLPQNSKLSRPASIAPGMASMMPLSTISIVVIEAVSAANASRAAAGKGSPAASSGRIVST